MEKHYTKAVISDGRVIGYQVRTPDGLQQVAYFDCAKLGSWQTALFCANERRDELNAQ